MHPKGEKKLEEHFREKTLKVLDHRPVPLPPVIIKKLDKMEKHWK